MNGAARKSVWESLQSALEARGVGVETTRGLPPVVMVEAIGDKEGTIGWNIPPPLAWGEEDRTILCTVSLFTNSYLLWQVLSHFFGHTQDFSGVTPGPPPSKLAAKLGS